jgi:hypothetical protein
VPHRFDPGLMSLESSIPSETRDPLRALGHDALAWSVWKYAAGSVRTIIKNLKSGPPEGSSDPRRPTAVAGW